MRNPWLESGEKAPETSQTDTLSFRTIKPWGIGDRFGDYLLVDCGNLPCVSGHDQFTNAKFTRPYTHCSKSTQDGRRKAHWGLPTMPTYRGILNTYYRWGGHLFWRFCKGFPRVPRLLGCTAAAMLPKQTRELSENILQNLRKKWPHHQVLDWLNTWLNVAPNAGFLFVILWNSADLENHTVESRVPNVCSPCE